jgi:hypothetical protein
VGPNVPHVRHRAAEGAPVAADCLPLRVVVALSGPEGDTMAWLLVGLLVGFVVGVLVGRKNKKKADLLAAAANKVEDLGKQAINKAKGK